MPLEIISHNVNGFERNKEFVSDICSSFPNVIYGLQEHWLRPPTKKFPGVNALKTVHSDLDGWGTSAMKSNMGSKILNGRPYGGTGYIWSKSIASVLKPRTEYIHERVTAVEISSSIGSIVIINCYMPYFKNNDVTTQTDLYIDTIGFIDSVIKDNPNSSFVVLGDMNCNYYKGNNQFSLILGDFIRNNNFYCTFDSMSSFDSNSNFTRCNLKQKSFSLLDYIFVSSDLIPFIDHVSIIDSGDVLSDHFPVRLSLSVDLVVSQKQQRSPPSLINWKNINESTRQNFENVMEGYLDGIRVPYILHGQNACNNTDHIGQIEKYYSDIVHCIKMADLQLPRCTPAATKGFWSDELTVLKNDSIVAHDFWKLNGCPRVGPVFEAKKNAYYRYKLRLKEKKNTFVQDKIDALNEDLADGDHHKFWRSFKYFNNSKCSHGSRINGLTDDGHIAGCFAKSFKDIYSNHDSQRSSKLLSEFHSLYDTYANEHANDSIGHLYLSWSEMLVVMSKLKLGKSSASFVKAEHIIYGSPKLAWHLHLLFNAMIQHSYVPLEFLNGVISPIIKDTEGNHSDPQNYRGLTLGVVFAYLFEHALLLKIGHLLNTDSLQFGYKKGHSTSHAIYSLRECIEYFTSRGSNVFAAFLDCTKGFDKVCHSGIYIKLIKRGIPLCILNLLIYWYANLTSTVKWNGTFSESFRVFSGVRQGGVLSPHLFAIYIDDLIVKLRSLKNGCYIADLFLACIVYADDICLLAPTRSAMQLLLNTCEEYGLSWCLTYNPKKTKVMIFGNDLDSPSLSMYGNLLDYVRDYKYLGVNVVAGSTFSTSHLKPLIKFRSSANTVLNIHKRPSEQVMLKLLYSMCIPNMTYASDVLQYSSKQMQSMNVALNDCFRRIFGYNRWESVRFLRLSFGYPSLTDTFHKQSRRFEARLPSLRNDTLQFLSTLHDVT